MKLKAMKYYILILTLGLILDAHASREQDLIEVASLIDNRLGYMQDVALYKAINHLPVEDIEREAIVLDKAAEGAQKSGIDSKSVRMFFRAQISAAKAIQYRYRADLLTMSESKSPKDLSKEVRPQLIELGARIIQTLSGYLQKYGGFKETDCPLFNANLTDPYLSEKDKNMICFGLLEIKPIATQ